MIICLETATNICSVALCDSAGVRYLKESSDSKSHSSLLTVFIEEILGEAGIRIRDLEAIAVSRGPGSYTGLRIGVSVAKGIAYALSIPVIAVDTTLSMFWGILADWDKETDLQSGNTLFCPMIDARRQEVYYALYDRNGSPVRPVTAEIINSDTFSDIPVLTKIIIFGDGAEKCKDLIKRDNVVFKDDFRISAAYMHTPVIQALLENRYEDVAYFEPFYLKDFITTKPRKNILGI
jgi:tRNA threonylcarbamoyladenosine biosynthesis protein TsaB